MHEFIHFFSNILKQFLIISMVDYLIYIACHHFHIGFFKSSRGDSCRTQSNTTGYKRASIIKRYHVLIGCNIGFYKSCLCFLTADILVS